MIFLESIKGSYQRNALFVGLLIFFGLSLISYVVIKQHKSVEAYAGYLIFVDEVGLDFIAAILTFFLWKKATNFRKNIFALFFISFIFLIINDVGYNVIVNIFSVTHFTSFISTLIYVPFYGCLFFQLLAWIVIFLREMPPNNKQTILPLFVPIIIILLIFIIFFLGSITWKENVFSLLGFYSILDAILQLLNFVFAFLCLSLAINKQIRILSIGYLMIIAAAFVVQIELLMQNLFPRGIIDFVWILGLIFIVYAFYSMLKNEKNLRVKQWLSSIQSIQAQCAFWAFLLCVIVLIMFWWIIYIFAGSALFQITPLQNLPSMLVMFSIAAVLISSAFARAFSSPFKRIEYILSSYLEEGKIAVLSDKGKSNIAEFIYLEDFLKKTFDELKEKNDAIKAIGVGIAHELRTPIRSIISGVNGVEKYLPILTQAYALAKEAGLSVETIYPHQLDLLYRLIEKLKTEGASANIIIDMLLMNIRESTIKQSQLASLSIAECVKKALERYSFQEGERELIYLNMEDDFKFMGDELLMIHIIFNLLKNALYYIADASKGKISIILERGEEVNKLYFKDTGTGISQEILPHIFDHFFSKTENGTGIGLSFCKMAMERINGEICCFSKEGGFTEFLLTFPILK